MHETIPINNGPAVKMSSHSPRFVKNLWIDGSKNKFHRGSISTLTEKTDSMEENFGGDFCSNSDVGSLPTKGEIWAKRYLKDLSEIDVFSSDGYDTAEYKIYHTTIDPTVTKTNQLMEHAVLAISPFNSYFTEKNITILIGWAMHKFKAINIFIPDGLSVYTLMAQGYTEEKATKKTKLQDSNLKNKVIRGLKNNGIGDESVGQYFLTTQRLTDNANYWNLYEKCVEKFKNDQEFRKICFLTSRNLLLKYKDDITEEMVQMAVNYILRELPVYLDIPKLLNVSSSFMVYHHVSEVDKYIYRHDSLSSSQQAYIAAKIVDWDQ
jgi:tRNA-dependent cyclodipeptide synthase